MRKLLINLFLLFFLIFQGRAYAQKIHIGDVIPLEIETSMDEEDLRHELNDFYIEEISEIQGGYRAEIRPRKTGINVIQIGKQKIEIEVEALLAKDDNMEAEELLITNNNSEKKELLIENTKFKKKNFPFYIFIFLPLLYPLYKYKIEENVKKEEINPYDEFERDFYSIKKDENFVFNLSYIFRRYVDRVEGSRFLYGEFDESRSNINDFILYLEEVKYNKGNIDFDDLKNRAKRFYEELRGGNNV